MGTRRLLLFALACAGAVALLRIERTEARSAARAPHRAEAVPGIESEGAGGPRVVDDATGDPVPGARLAFHRRWEAEPFSLAVTDDEGCFDPGTAERAVVRADGYPTQLRAIEERGDLRLKRGVERTFTIVDDEGHPGAHAHVDVYGDYNLDILLSTAEADACGKVTLALIGSEAMLVRFRDSAYVEVRGDVVVLRPGYTLGGHVLDSAGRPVAGARVYVRQGDG
jgi:hypothetical protein